MVYKVDESQLETSLDCERRRTPGTGGEDSKILVIARNVDQWRASIQDFNEEEFNEMSPTSSTGLILYSVCRLLNLKMTSSLLITFIGFIILHSIRGAEFH